MNKIEKFLKKLSKKEKFVLEECIENILNDKIEILDVKKLKGRDDIFRVRKGNIRIVYRKLDGNIMLLSIEYKNDNTYKDY